MQPMQEVQPLQPMQSYAANPFAMQQKYLQMCSLAVPLFVAPIKRVSYIIFLTYNSLVFASMKWNIDMVEGWKAYLGNNQYLVVFTLSRKFLVGG